MCMSYNAFRRALTFGFKTCHEDNERANETLVPLSEVIPSKVKGHPEVSLPLKCPLTTNLVERISD